MYPEENKNIVAMRSQLENIKFKYDNSIQPVNAYCKINLTCRLCLYNTNQYIPFANHIFKCFQYDSDMIELKSDYKSKSLNNKEEFSKLLKSIEKVNFVSFVKKNNSNKKTIKTIYHCNFKSYSEYIVPCLFYLTYIMAVELEYPNF